MCHKTPFACIIMIINIINYYFAFEPDNIRTMLHLSRSLLHQILPGRYFDILSVITVSLLNHERMKQHQISKTLHSWVLILILCVCISSLVSDSTIRDSRVLLLYESLVLCHGCHMYLITQAGLAGQAVTASAPEKIEAREKPHRSRAKDTCHYLPQGQFSAAYQQLKTWG